LVAGKTYDLYYYVLGIDYRPYGAVSTIYYDSFTTAGAVTNTTTKNGLIIYLSSILGLISILLLMV